MLQMVAAQISNQIPIYKQFMAQEQDEDLVRVLDGNNPPAVLGSEKFICWIKDRFFKKKMHKEVPASKELASDLNTIISEVSRYYEIRPSTLKAVRRGIKNEPRDVAMYLIRAMRSEPLMRVGADFGLNRYSSVSSAVVRVKIKLQKDRKFKSHLECIKNNILKGQTKTPNFLFFSTLFQFVFFEHTWTWHLLGIASLEWVFQPLILNRLVY